MKVYCVWEKYENYDDSYSTNLLGIYYELSSAESSCKDWIKSTISKRYSYFVTEEAIQ